jgi:Uma2 family endonuclease
MNQPVKRHHRYSYEEYLSHEEASNVKHEFLAGEIYAMAGGTPQHAALAVSVSSALFTQLRGGPCVVHSSDLKVRVTATGLATYPDVTVVCGPIIEDPKSKHVVLNPTLLVEVTSPSSEEWDRGEKLLHYLQVPSLAAYLLVSHTAPQLELVVRLADGSCTRTVANAGESLEIPNMNVRLAVNDVYAGIVLG